MTNEQLLKLCESLRRDKTKLMVCLNTFLAEAVVSGNKDHLDRIKTTLNSLENAKYEQPVNANI
jgi:malonyl CoA-acyl carrier protein transacylase